jgi:hypothetical protein
MTTYKLTITEQQASIIVRALDLFARIGTGQFEEVLNVYDRDFAFSPEAREGMRSALKAAKAHAGHPPNGSFSILNPKVSDDFRAAYDVMQVIRHRLAWDQNPQGNPLRVDFDKPRQTSALPMANIERVE